jgi:hypothetical protein
MKRPFKIIKQDDKQRMQISFEGLANIYLIKTDEGFVIDVYNNKDEEVHTACVWNMDLPLGEPTDEEIDKFKKDWGQTHEEITANLELELNGSDELLMDDYFWIDNDQIWCNKHASMFTEREQEIADFLIEVLSRVD